MKELESFLHLDQLAIFMHRSVGQLEIGFIAFALLMAIIIHDSLRKKKHLHF